MFIGLSACGSSGGTAISQTYSFTDTAGRVVQVPLKVNRLVTVGYPPVSDGWVAAVGGENLLVNGIPGYDSSEFYRAYKILAPRLIRLPNVESALGGPINPEELLTLKPDVAITADAATANQIQKLGVPAVVINDLSTGVGIERDVTLVGQLLNKQKAAAGYVSYFNNIINQVRQTAATVPAAERPSVLYASMGPLTRPNLVMGWMLGVIGAHDVTAGITVPAYKFSIEQLFVWDPDVIIGHDPSDLPGFMQNPQFSTLQAVRTKRVGIIPQGLNTWGDNTAEQPLGLLWTAKYLYPMQFAKTDMAEEVKTFYSRFLQVNLTDAQANQILNAGTAS
ncbi:MAG: ABC transporter substrate-binding protein [Pseudonocardiales bacterium]|nr:ABC transporter substrate-binding protein [Pseudonocardiales bacterium]MBV9728996.1 ABC transporter substrate-binding protein [Pseudonocardiales bacterium]